MKNKVPFSFGHLPDSPDSRDFKFKLTSAPNLPESIDLREDLQPIKNQGSLGACTAFATTALVEFVRNKQKFLKWDASPLFTYYSTRKIRNNTAEDSGAQCREALKSAVKDGVAKETSWPYLIEKFTENPPEEVWAEAEKHQALVYYSVEQTRESILGCLAEGYPFTFGAKLYQSFIDTQCGFLVHNYLSLPDKINEKLIGGHCMLAVGYTVWNDNTYIIVRNSWGPYVGLNGHHNIPIEYLLDPTMCMDFWTIRTEEATEEDPLPPPLPPPAPEPTPEPPAPEPIPEPPKPFPVDPTTSMWKKPTIYFMIIFAIFCVFFCFAKN